MTSLQLSHRPLAFKAGNTKALLGTTAPVGFSNDELAIRVYARALEGMQKEALVYYAPTGVAWRMVCDEGPYLNGTDLAPFPLAFFTAGLASSILSELLALLDRHDGDRASVELIQDNRYTMSGSAIQGTMTGGALPVELNVTIRPDLHSAALQERVVQAVSASPACGLLRGKLTSAFALSINGRPVPTGRVSALHEAPVPEPDDRAFDALAPAARDECASPLIQKRESAQTVLGVAGGAGSSLAAEQKRTLHIRGFARLRSDGLKEIRTQLLSPIGSVFQFLSDDSARFGGLERAPSGLAYLSAGIAFCYLTQLGRYAHIVKKPLGDYRIVQDTRFGLPGAGGGTRSLAAAQPVRTHVFLHTDGEPDDYGQQAVDMGEQTCFLHAACRDVVKVKLRRSSSAT